jgi:hypothetical protein
MTHQSLVTSAPRVVVSYFALGVTPTMSFLADASHAAILTRLRQQVVVDDRPSEGL